MVKSRLSSTLHQHLTNLSMYGWIDFANFEPCRQPCDHRFCSSLSWSTDCAVVCYLEYWTLENLAGRRRRWWNRQSMFEVVSTRGAVTLGLRQSVSFHLSPKPRVAAPTTLLADAHLFVWSSIDDAGCWRPARRGVYKRKVVHRLRDAPPCQSVPRPFDTCVRLCSFASLHCCQPMVINERLALASVLGRMDDEWRGAGRIVWATERPVRRLFLSAGWSQCTCMDIGQAQTFMMTSCVQNAKQSDLVWPRERANCLATSDLWSTFFYHHLVCGRIRLHLHTHEPPGFRLNLMWKSMRCVPVIVPFSSNTDRCQSVSCLVAQQWSASAFDLLFVR